MDVLDFPSLLDVCCKCTQFPLKIPGSLKVDTCRYPVSGLAFGHGVMKRDGPPSDFRIVSNIVPGSTGFGVTISMIFSIARHSRSGLSEIFNGPVGHLLEYFSKSQMSHQAIGVDHFTVIPSTRQILWNKMATCPFITRYEKIR